MLRVKPLSGKFKEDLDIFNKMVYKLNNIRILMLLYH